MKTTKIVIGLAGLLLAGCSSPQQHVEVFVNGKQVHLRTIAELNQDAHWHTTNFLASLGVENPEEFLAVKAKIFEIPGYKYQW